MRWLTATLVALLVGLTAQAASINATLVRASNTEAETDARLKEIEPRLKKVFGFQHYQQLGQQSASLQVNERKRLGLGEGFTIFVTPKSAENKVYSIELEWYSGKTQLVKTTVPLSEKEPVLIKGPAVGKDWILLALTLQP